MHKINKNRFIGFKIQIFCEKLKANIPCLVLDARRVVFAMT